MASLGDVVKVAVGLNPRFRGTSGVASRSDAGSRPSRRDGGTVLGSAVPALKGRATLACRFATA